MAHLIVDTSKTIGYLDMGSTYIKTATPIMANGVITLCMVKAFLVGMMVSLILIDFYINFTVGKTYEGQYKNDHKNGIGIFKWKDGRSYRGQWANGVQHGFGIFTSIGNNIVKS